MAPSKQLELAGLAKSYPWQGNARVSSTACLISIRPLAGSIQATLWQEQEEEEVTGSTTMT